MALIMPNSVFLHVPKTGGSWCREAIKNAGISHHESGNESQPWLSRIHAPRSLVLSESEDKFVFAFVRDPLDWWRSYWGYRQRRGWRNHPIDNTCRSNDFDDFIRYVVRYMPGWLSKTFEQFVGLEEDEISFIGRFESLADDLVVALQQAGESFDEEALRLTPKVNVNNYDRWPANCSANQGQALLAKEMKAIRRFGYSNVPLAGVQAS